MGLYTFNCMYSKMLRLQLIQANYKHIYSPKLLLIKKDLTTICIPSKVHMPLL
jgi:hypothetical protein